jgi:hypothetical protein
MRVCVAALTIAIALALSGSAHAQAATETVLTHSLSSSMGSAVGKTLGRATGQLAGKLGQQTASTVSRKRAGTVQRVQSAKTAPAKLDATAPTGTPASGLLIASIQGGERPAYTCAPANKKAQTEPNKAAPSSKAATPPGCVEAQATTPPLHPSFVNLPPAK